MDQLAAMATFVRAVDSGSLSAAARSLPSSLTSVSRQISALEEVYGTRLLLRTTRQLALTDEGRILYERAKSILGEVKEIEAALSHNRHQPSGRIRVSSPSLMGRLVIAPLLADFLRRYPVRRVATYGPPAPQRQARSGQPLDQEMIDRLRSLGYVK